LIAGAITVIAGEIVVFIGKWIGILNSVSLPNECDKWNENFVMERSLFLTGMLAYFAMIKINVRISNNNENNENIRYSLNP